MAFPYDPYSFLPELPTFTLTSESITDGQPLGNAQVSGIFGAGGQDVSPQLSWSGFPEETKSFAVTCYDPDAPTGSGFWHWVLFDVPVTVTELATGAGTADIKTGTHTRNDYGNKKFDGSAPPPGTPHRYAFCVHALDTEKLGVGSDTSPAVVGFNVTAHTLARALIVPVYGH